LLLVIDDAWRIETALAFKVGGSICAYLILLANPKGDRKGPRSTPLLSRPYKDMERVRQQCDI